MLKKENDTVASPFSLPVSLSVQINHGLSHLLVCLSDPSLLEVIGYRLSRSVLVQALHEDGWPGSVLHELAVITTAAVVAMSPEVVESDSAFLPNFSSYL